MGRKRKALAVFTEPSHTCWRNWTARPGAKVAYFWKKLKSCFFHCKVTIRLRLLMCPYSYISVPPLPRLLLLLPLHVREWHPRWFSYTSVYEKKKINCLLQHVSLANSHGTPGDWAAVRLWELVQNPWIKICHSHISGFHRWTYRRGMVAQYHVISWWHSCFYKKPSRYFVKASRLYVKLSRYFAIAKGSLSRNSEIIFM